MNRLRITILFLNLQCKQLFFDLVYDQDSIDYNTLKQSETNL